MEINHTQGSPEWLAWRKSKITASIIPIIMGKSPYCTRYLLWQRMLGFVPEQKSNWAMKRGNDLEPMVRDLANIEHDCQFRPMVVQHDELEWCAASLDGICKIKHAILEIKCPSLADHKEAEEGRVPLKYQDQIAWQLFCSGMNTCYYVSFHDGVIVTVKVKRDDEYIAETLLPAAAEFYRCLTEMIEPSYTDKDFVQIVDDKFEYYAEKWKKANETIKDYKKIEDECKKQLVELTDDSNCEGYGLRLQRVSKEGSVDYKMLYEDILNEFPEVSKFHVEQYKRKEIGYWLVSKLKSV